MARKLVPRQRLLSAAILLNLVFSVQCQFDEDNPPEEENFDPANADPRGSISCFGTIPAHHFGFTDFTIPQTGDVLRWSDYTSVQQLCAKPQYGGMPGYKNLGGFCDAYDDPPRMAIAFDSTNYAQASAALQDLNLVTMFCMMRCNCTRATEDQVLNNLVARDANGHQYDFRPYLIDPQIEVGAEALRLGQGAYENWLAILSLNQTALQHDAIFYLPAKAISRTRNLDCSSGGVPRDIATALNSIDRPWTRIVQQWQSMGNSLQALCANVFEGGNPFFNAGGYCYEHYDDEYEVAFYDDWTPDRALTWDYGYQALLVRGLCYQQCKCPRERKKKNSLVQMPGIFAFLQDRQLGISSSRGAQILIDDQAFGQTRALGLLNVPVHTDGGSTRQRATVGLGACKTNPHRFCPSPDEWSTELLGPKPTDIAPPALPDQDDLTAVEASGQTCTANTDCTASGGSGSGWKCIFPKIIPQYIPLDPVFPSRPTLPRNGGRCMRLPAAIMQLASGLGG